MRASVYSLLVDMSKIYKPNKLRGVYPPKINISNDQTIEEMFCEIKKIVTFMKNPEYSYLMKNKKDY